MKRKIIIINHTFQKPEFCKRWKMLANNHKDLDVILLAPTKWEWGKYSTMTYGSIDVLRGEAIDEGNYHIHLIDMNDTRFGDWTSTKLESEIKASNPDLVYFIGGFTSAALMQIFNIKKKLKMTFKVCAFTMRGHTPTIDFKKQEKGLRKYINYLGKLLYLGPRYKRFKKESDAVFCHYPAARDAFIKEGYKKPIYIQTQVGVDPDIFHFNELSRSLIRQKYAVGDSFLFGSATRFNSSKGLSQVIQALPQDGNWKYLMMGWGKDDEVNAIKKQIEERGLGDKIILTGFIDNWNDMAKHWCALDCAIHTPLTTLRWEETFSLALVQAMATGLPVIGSDSGSVPYQIGSQGIIVREGDIEQLSEKMKYAMEHTDVIATIGDRMKKRAVNCFGIYHLNELFYKTIIDIMNDTFDPNKSDMSTYVGDF